MSNEPALYFAYMPIYGHQYIANLFKFVESHELTSESIAICRKDFIIKDEDTNRRTHVQYTEDDEK